MDKKKLFVAAATCAALMIVSMSVRSFRGQYEEWFQDNVEALSDLEILVRNPLAGERLRSVFFSVLN